MAHVELSLSGAFVPQARTPAEAEFVASIDRWMMTVNAAVEPCLVIDATTTVRAASPSCTELLGLGKPADAVDQPLLGGVLRLIDFTAGGSEPHLTVDAIATPLFAADQVVASLTFFSPVRY